MKLNKFIYELGSRYRNPSLNKWFRFLLETDTWSRKELEKYQDKKLIELVAHAKLNSKYYRNKYKNIEVNSLEDLTKLPITEKEDLVRFNSEIHTNYKCRTVWAKTSGSSGNPLRFKRNESADSLSRALIKRGYFWHDIHPADRNLYFWGFNHKGIEFYKTRFLDFLQNRFRIFNFSKDSLDYVKKNCSELIYISGYSSMINDLAVKLNKSNLSFPKLKMIKATSEKILPIYIKNIKDTFNMKVINEYGATESGIIGFECPEGNMHVAMEGVIVEECEGELIVTNLELKSFPIIRYRLGDYIELDKKTKCPCGRNHQIIKSVKGRIGSLVIGKNYTYPSLTFYRIFGNLSKKGFDYNYQVYQHKKGFIEVRIDDEIGKGKNAMKEEFENYFLNDIEFSVVENYDFGVPLAKKKFFINELNF